MEMMSIADLVFDLDHLSLRASIEEDSLVWSLSIASAPRDILGESWRPRAYSESLLGIEGMRINEWHEAFDHDLCWGDGFNEATRRPNASLFVFEHTQIYDSVLRITAGPSSSFEIKWRAKCDVFFGPYQSDLDLKVDATGRWEGVVVGSRGEKISGGEASRRLSKHIKMGAFEFCPALEDHDYPLMRLSGSQVPQA